MNEQKINTDLNDGKNKNTNKNKRKQNQKTTAKYIEFSLSPTNQMTDRHFNSRSVKHFVRIVAKIFCFSSSIFILLFRFVSFRFDKSFIQGISLTQCVSYLSVIRCCCCR